MVNRALFWLVLFICIFSFFNRNNYRNVGNIAPESLREPFLEEIADKEPILVTGNGYKLTLVPVNACRINGMIVESMGNSFMVSRSCRSMETRPIL